MNRPAVVRWLHARSNRWIASFAFFNDVLPLADRISWRARHAMFNLERRKNVQKVRPNA